MSPKNAALTPRHRLQVARLVVEDGWPISDDKTADDEAMAGCESGVGM